MASKRYLAGSQAEVGYFSLLPTWIVEHTLYPEVKFSGGGLLKIRKCQQNEDCDSEGREGKENCCAVFVLCLKGSYGIGQFLRFGPWCVTCVRKSVKFPMDSGPNDDGDGNGCKKILSLF